MDGVEVTLDELQALRARLAPGNEVNAAYWLVSGWIAHTLGMPNKARNDMERALAADASERAKRAPVDVNAMCAELDGFIAELQRDVSAKAEG